jgi:murein DD-endopeptidase MepM/ murein hydrolase activator NlpD
VSPANKESENIVRSTPFYRRFLISIKIFFKKLWKTITQKMTVMLVPHSENGSFHFKISFLSIFISLLIFISLILVGIFSITENVEANNKIDQLIDEHITVLNELEEFKETVPRLNEVYYHLNKAVSKLNEASGDITKDLDTNTNQFNTEYLAKKVLESDAMEYNEIVELLKLEYNIEKLIPEIESVATYLENYKKIFDVIPSINPVVGRPYIVSDFGWRYDPFTKKRRYHYGIDMKEALYTKIRASASGKVVIAKYSSSAGNYIKIEHEYGFSSVYMHLSKIKVEPGQSVVKGQIIGLLGSTGRSQGPHLHYEVRINNKHVNPTPYLRLNKIFE